MEKTWIEVLTTYDEMEAHIVKGALETEDIQVIVNSLKISPYPVSVGKIGEVRLLVRSEDYDKAKRVLKIMQTTNGKGPNDNRNAEEE